MADFLGRAKKFEERRKAEVDNNFAKKVLLKICELYAIDVRADKNTNEFGFAWFHKSHPDFPVSLSATREDVDLEMLALSMPKNKIWHTFMDRIEETTKAHTGLVVSVVKHGYWVMHDHCTCVWVPGGTRIMHQGSYKNMGVIFEPLPQFLANCRAGGFVP